MVGRVLRRGPNVPVTRERWTTPDGDFLDVDVGDTEGRVRGAVLILHGLEGSSARSYVRILMAYLIQRDLRPVALNFRSCSGEPNLLARSYHAGETRDLAFALESLRRRWPGLPLATVGFSLGGNVMLKHLAERGQESGIRAAVAVSVPFDLAAGARMIGRGAAGAVYTGYFLRSLRRKVLAKRDLLDQAQVQAALEAPNLVAFDDALTAPLHGFSGAAEYYQKSSSGPLLERIHTPTLIIHSEDDPFFPAAHLPAALRTHGALRLVLTRRGGHMGFLESATRCGPDSGNREARLNLACWGERQTAEFLAARFAPLEAV